jgi:hypothetical protein
MTDDNWPNTRVVDAPIAMVNRVSGIGAVYDRREPEPGVMRLQYTVSAKGDKAK